jgi:hypothetical protein
MATSAKSSSPLWICSTPGFASRLATSRRYCPALVLAAAATCASRVGWAAPTRKIKGMFVRPEQIAEIGKRHPELGRLRLVVSRAGEVDVMTLKAETTGSDDGLREAVSATLRSVTKLGGIADLVVPGLLPNDGRIIADERGH